MVFSLAFALILSPQGRDDNNQHKLEKIVQKSIACLFGILLMSGSALGQGQSSSVAAEKAIIELENQWLQAAKTQNPDLIVTNYDDRMLNTASSGEVLTKAQEIKYLKTTKFSKGSYQDMQVRVFGDTAIAAGVFTAAGIEADGKPFDIHERWTDTWIKASGGKWVCIASHSSTIAK